VGGEKPGCNKKIRVGLMLHPKHSHIHQVQNTTIKYPNEKKIIPKQNRIKATKRCI
jgi:hypothetical protein